MNQSGGSFPEGFRQVPAGRFGRLLSALEKLSADIAQSITSLNQKYLEDEAPDGVYWEECGASTS